MTKRSLGQRTTTRDYKDIVKDRKVLPLYVEIPRLTTSFQEKIREIQFQLFGNANIIGTSAVAYAVIQQTSSTMQEFISCKAS